MSGQDALRLMPQAEAQARQTAFTVLVEIALDSASGDIGERGDLVVVQSVALEPEDFHLALDTGVGVMEAIVGQGSAVFVGQMNRAHGGSTG